ncbi:MAG: DUF4446 family protein [Candidatus Limnocylindrales bacterium]
MSQLNDFVASHLAAIGVVIFIGCVVVLLLVLMLFIQSRRIALLSERLDSLTQGADGQSLEGVLATHLDTVVRVAQELDEVTARTAILEAGARMHFGRLGLVRFNPFDDTGGNQSFSLAILDANNDGFVMSSLHSRTATRVYSKAIFGGECETTLGAEEAQAVEIAVSQGGGSSAPRTSRAAAARGTTGRGSGRGKAAGTASGAARPDRPKQAAAMTASSGESAEPMDAGSGASEPEPAEAGSAPPPA